jgi:hypothetical protein
LEDRLAETLSRLTWDKEVLLRGISLPAQDALSITEASIKLGVDTGRCRGKHPITASQKAAAPHEAHVCLILAMASTERADPGLIAERALRDNGLAVISTVIINGVINGLDAIRWLLPFTRLLIEHNWPDVERIAASLIVNKTLDYQQVVDLIQR